MPPRRRPWLAVVVLTLAAIAVIALGGRWVWESSRLVPERGGAYVEAVAGRPQHVNPLLSHFNDIDRDLVALVFAGLVKADPDGRLAPDLAKGWEISADGLVYTFQLDPERRWHNGQPVTAEDVAFTIGLLQDPSFPGLPDLAEPWQDVKVETEGDHTILFTLPRPFGPFLERATLGILPAHQFGQITAAGLPGHAFNGFPVGAGPFKVTQADVRQVTLVPDPAYPGPQPYLESITFRFYPSTRAALTALREGKATGARYITAEEAVELNGDQRLRVLTAPYLGRATLLLLNMQRPPLDDPAVRQAMTLAIDRDTIIDETLLGQGEAAFGPISPLSWGFSELATPGPDPDRAGMLLEQAGWVDRNGDGTREKDGDPLAIVIATSDAPERRRAANSLALQLGRVGIKVEVVSTTWEEFRDRRLVPRDFVAALAEFWLPSLDPDVFALYHSSQTAGGFNFSGWRNGRADDLLLRGREAWSENVRRGYYDEFQLLFADEVPAVYLYYPRYHFVLSAEVRGASLAPLLEPADRFNSLPDWYLRTKRVFFDGVSPR